MKYYVCYRLYGNFKVYISKSYANIEKFINDCLVNEGQIDIKLIDYTPKLYNPLFIKMEIERMSQDIKNYTKFLNHLNLRRKYENVR